LNKKVGSYEFGEKENKKAAVGRKQEKKFIK
jgi:hypothetical protein